MQTTQPRTQTLGPFSLRLLTDFQAVEAPLDDVFRLEEVLHVGRDKVVVTARRDDERDAAFWRLYVEKVGPSPLVPPAAQERVVLRLRPLDTVQYADLTLDAVGWPEAAPYREMALSAAHNQRAALAAFQRAGISLLNAEFETEWHLRRLVRLVRLLPLPATVPPDLAAALAGDTLYLVSVSTACRATMQDLFPRLAASALATGSADVAAAQLAAAVGSYLLQVMAQLHLFRSVMPDFNHGDLWPRNVVLCRAPRPAVEAVAYVFDQRVIFYAPLLRNEAGEAMVWRIIDLEFLSGTYRGPAPEPDARLAPPGGGVGHSDLEALDHFVRQMLLAPGPGGWLHDTIADVAMRNRVGSVFFESSLPLVLKESAATQAAATYAGVYAWIVQLVPLLNGSRYYSDADLKAAEAAGRLEVVQLPPAPMPTHVGARIAAALARKE